MIIIRKVLLVASLSGMLNGCMTFELEGDGVHEPASAYETVHGSIYGFKWKEPTVEKCFDGQGIYRVEFHTNAGFLLVSVLSVGLYVPQTAEWWCQAADDDDDGPIFEGGGEGQSDEVFIEPSEQKSANDGAAT